MLEGNLKYGKAAKEREDSCYDISESLKIHYNERAFAGEA